MSRIGRTQILIPAGVEVDFTGGVLTVKGPKGTLKRDVRNEVNIKIEDGKISVEPVKKTRLANNLWGTYASHAKNMVQGVSEGYKKELIISGVGYRCELKGNTLVFRVGFSHEVEIVVPEGLIVAAKDNTIKIDGFDKELVGSFAAKVRAVKKPEPYKGKGIRYSDEVIRRKQGKKTA